MMLGASVASADCDGPNPQLCMGLYNGQDRIDRTPQGWDTVWRNLDFGRYGSNIYTPTWGQTILDNLRFEFAEGTEGINGSLTSSNGATIKFSSSPSISYVSKIILEGKNQESPIQMGKDGNGKLTVDFGTDSSFSRAFVLYIKSTREAYAFRGNIDIILGARDNNFAALTSMLYNDFKGNIKITTNLATTPMRTEFKFYNNYTDLRGNFDAFAGNNSLIFYGQNSSIDGSVSANQSAYNTITFEESGSTIYGNITANRGTNSIVFNKSSATIEADSGRSSVIAENSGRNDITFKQGDTRFQANLITRSGGSNNLTFGGSNALLGFGPKTDGTNSNTTVTFRGSNSRVHQVFEATNGGVNDFTFEGSDSHIDTNIVATNGGRNTIGFGGDDSYAKNKVVANGANASNSVTFRGNNSRISATVNADNGGRNTISFSGTNSYIVGSPHARGTNSSNTITFERDNGYLGSNLRSDNGGSNTVTFRGNNSYIAGDVVAWNTNSNNTITFDGMGARIGESGQPLKVVSADGVNTRNTIRFTNSSSNNSYINSEVKAIAGGSNTISFSGSRAKIAGGVTARGNHSTSSSNTIDFSGGEAFIGGALSAQDKGVNTITFGGAQSYIAGNADAIGTGSKNTIRFNGADSYITGDINTDGAETSSTITFQGDRSRIDGAISVSGRDAINTITLQGNSTEIKGSITARNGGTNNILFSGQDPKVKGPNILTQTGGINNIILTNGVWGEVNNNNRTKDLYNEDGTNTFVFRAPSSDTAKTTYNINTIKKGTSNLVLQGLRELTTLNISYEDSASTMFILANSNDNANDSFAKDATNIAQDKILGKTYQDGVKFVLADKIVGVNWEKQSIIENYGDAYKTANGGKLFTIASQYDNANASTKATITGLAVGSISGLATTKASSYDFTLSENSAILGDMDFYKSNQAEVSLTMKKGSKLIIDNQNTSKKLTLKSLDIQDAACLEREQLKLHPLQQTHTIIDLATSGNGIGHIEVRKDFKLLNIAEQKGGIFKGDNALFSVYVNNKASQGSGGATLGDVASNNGNGTYGYSYSDRIIVHQVQSTKPDTPLTEYIQIIPDAGMNLGSVSYAGGGTETKGNIAIFTVKNDNRDRPLITLENTKEKDTLVGYDVIGTQLTDGVKTDAYGKTTGSNSKDYTTYFIKSMASTGASKANKKAAISALGLNYHLYLANLNSLNKRMGELREGEHTQGTWARIFNGMQSTNFEEALDTRAIYTTFQAGYDYGIKIKDANNYLGFALSYANSIATSKNINEINGIAKGIKQANSNAIEFAIYNAYIQDGASQENSFKNGLYTDSILKFSYIMGNFVFADQSTQTYKNDNFALSLSQEVGYRFLLGSNKELFIDPQAEFALGYLSQSALKQQQGQYFMTSIQDSVFTLRSRIGSSVGYKFDRFTENKGFKAQAYLGAFAVSDIFMGGGVSMTTNNGTASLKPLTSTARFVLNLGTNFKIKDNTRIYFDFERSFGGKITTDYQVNLGVRYSFGALDTSNVKTATIKDNNTIKEVEPTKGLYVELLEKEANTLSSKEKKVLEKLGKNLRTQTKIQNNKTMKVYLVGPFKDETKAKEGKAKLEGIIKELKGKGSIVEVE